MVGMIVTNGQVGVSSFQGNAGFASNFCHNSISLCGFSLRWRPSSGIDLKVKNGRVKRGMVFQAILKGGSGGKSVSGAILEKEFEFKPSFGEYLKVMESVKTMKHKKQTNTGSEKDNSVDNLREISLVDGKEKDVKLSASEENLKIENKSTVIEKDGSVKNGDMLKKQERKTTKFVDMKASFDNEERSPVVKERRRPGKDVADRKWLKQQTCMEEEEKEEEEEEEENVDIDDHNKEMRRENRRKGSSSEMFEKKGIDDRKSVRTDDGINNFRGGFESRVRDSNAIKQRRLNRGYEDFVDKSSDGERAAFRHLSSEVNILMDGRRRPRVEMDKRIQKLAKSLNGADIDMPEWMFAKMMRSAQIIFTDHSISRVIQILGQYGNWRRVLQVIEWLQIRERYKSHKLRYVYTTALNVLGKARRPVEALNVFKAMLQQMSSYPDIVAYHSIAVTLGQAGHMKELFDVMDTMRSPPMKQFKTGALRNWDPRLEPDIIVYNAVLNACVQRKQWEGGFWVLQQMKEKRLAPSVTTYGLAMEVMFACGKYNLVHDFFKKVQKSSIPNALTYRVLLNTLWKEGKLNEAIHAIKDMEKRGIVGSAALYYDFARCLCSAGRSRDALMQVEKICKVANKPLVVTYTGLIQACLDSGNIEDGAYIFNYMKDFCAPNLITCNIMLKGYLKHGMFERGKELFMEMVEGYGHIKNRVDHKVLAAPDIYTYNTILEACVSEKRWDDFEEAYRMMLKNGYNFNSKRHLQMLLDASRVGKGDLLDVTWNHLVESNRSPPSALVKQWFCMKLEKEDYARALECICNQNLAGSPEFSKKAWSKLLEENSVMFREGTFVRLVQEISNIISRNEELSPVLDNLLASCKDLSYRASLLTQS